LETILTLAREPGKSAKTAGFCMGYVALAVLFYPSTFVSVLGQYPIARYYVVIPPLLLVGLLAAALLHRPRSPLGFMRDKLAHRGVGAALILGVFIISATAFTTLKHEYSFLAPFFADPLLADMDQALHFGDPWKHLRAITPEALDPVLYSLYSQLWFVQVVATVLYAALVAERSQREHYFASLALSAILLSSIVRLAGSSGGPVFYDRLHGGTRFADLIVALQNSPAGPKTLALSNYLYDSFATNTSVLGTGISAMPSLHVALAFLNALFISSRSRIAGYAAWTYAALIMFGSVYFGWHYALDGYVAIAAVLFFWRLSAPAAAR